jgi:chromate transporter
LIGGQAWKSRFLVIGGHDEGKSQAVIDDRTETPAHAVPSLGRAIKVTLFCAALWWFPVLLVGLSLGREHAIYREGLFFSKAAMVTFGGAYAVLPYVSQEAVQNHHWLSAGEMLDGLGLAETTPGPLIMVLQFVGFMGGWHHPGSLTPLAAATLGALITTWTTFVPCFLWILVGAPHIEQMRGNKRLTAALSAVTAAVVGVVLNLAVWFGWHVLFPSRSILDLFAAIVTLVAWFGMFRWKWNVIPVVIGAGVLGLVFKFALR